MMVQAIKPTQLAFKKMEAEWYNYHHTIREIARLREEIANPWNPEDKNTGGGKANVISDPTAKLASRLALSKQLKYLDDIVYVIEQVFGVLSDDHKELVRIRYWSKEELTWEGVAYRLHKSERQCRRWRNEIIQSSLELIGWR